MRDCSLFSFLLKSFPTETEFMETHNCLCKMWSWKAPSGGIFHSSPVLTTDQVKNRYHCARLVYLSGVILLCSFFQLRCRCVDKLNWRWECSCYCLNPMFRHSPVGKVMSNSTQHSSKLWSRELLWAEVPNPLRAENNWTFVILKVLDPTWDRARHQEGGDVLRNINPCNIKGSWSYLGQGKKPGGGRGKIKSLQKKGN